MDLPAIVNLIATNGIGVACAGFLMWLLWFRETRTHPRTLDTFAKVQKQSLDTFSELMREEREDCQKQNAETRQRVDRLAEKLDAHLEGKK